MTCTCSLFPWLAIEMGRTELGNAPGFDATPFASFESARLSVRVLPLLLRRQVVVGTAALDSLTVNLQVRKDGTGNWEDLGAAGEPEPAAAEPEAADRPATIDVASVAVTDAALTYSDATTGDRFELTDLDLTSGRIAAGEAVPLDGGFSFKLDPAGLSGRVDIGLVVAFDADAAAIAVSELDIDGRVEGVAEVPATVRLRAPSIRAADRGADGRCRRDQAAVDERRPEGAGRSRSPTQGTRSRPRRSASPLSRRAH